MATSGFLERVKMEKRELVSVTERVIRQLMLDTLQATLHDVGFGYEKIQTITDLWSDKYNSYRKALNTKDPEADVVQEHLDRELADILKKRELIPFQDRYPDIKKVEYKAKRQRR